MIVPGEAVTLADDVLQRAGACVSREDVREAVEAAGGVIAAAERERLREAFARMQQLAAAAQKAAIALAVAAERARLADIATELRAAFPADHPPGAMASFGDYIRTYGAPAVKETP